MTTRGFSSIWSTSSPHISPRRSGFLKIILYYKTLRSSYAHSTWVHFVLSGLRPHLASHFGKSSSNHGYGHDLSDDSPNCFASSTLSSGSLVKYAGQANQERQLEGLRESLQLQREQFEMARTQFERAERLNDRAEKIQDAGSRMMTTARRAMVVILPIIFFLLVYLSWLMLR